MTTLTGRLIHLVGRETRFGFRAAGVIERIDWSTGEVFEIPFKAWKETAFDLFDFGLGAHVGIKCTKNPKTGEHVARKVSEVRFIDPAKIDLSRYL
jgi:hypothetical protein